MNENNPTQVPFAEGAAAFISETLQVYDRIKKLRGTDSGMDANLSSLLLTEGLDQLIAANLEESDEEWNYRRIPLVTSTDNSNSVSTTSTTIVTFPAPDSANAPNSKVSCTLQHNNNEPVERIDFDKVRNKEQDCSHSVCSQNKSKKEVVQPDNNSRCTSSETTRALIHPRAEGCIHRKKEKKVWTRESLQEILRRMKKALNAMEEQVMKSDGEQLPNQQLKEEENKNSFGKRPKKEPKKYMPSIANDSSFSDDFGRFVTNRKESSTSISYATIENMSAQLYDDNSDNNNNRENMWNELQSTTKYFLKTLRNDWKDSLPSALSLDRLPDKSRWNPNELCHILTMSVQFLCGRSAAISERESCLEAEMRRLDEFERELSAREACVVSRERKFVDSMKMTRFQSFHGGGETSWRVGKEHHFGDWRKQNVAYLSIPASESTNDIQWKDSEDSSRVGSGCNRHLSDLRSRVRTAEHRLRKICHHLARSSKGRYPCTFSTTESVSSGKEESGISSESSMPKKSSMPIEFEELKTELLHQYSTLQNSLTEALKSISSLVEEQRVHSLAAMDSEKQEHGKLGTFENQSMNVLRSIETSTCCLDSPSLLEALNATEREWIRRLEVLKAIISENDGYWKQGVDRMDTNEPIEASRNIPSSQKLSDFILAFVRENEALDLYWRRALDSIPEQLERTNASETAFSETVRPSV